jgi:hypothetical protein
MDRRLCPLDGSAFPLDAYATYPPSNLRPATEDGKESGDDANANPNILPP